MSCMFCEHGKQKCGELIVIVGSLEPPRRCQREIGHEGPHIVCDDRLGHAIYIGPPVPARARAIQIPDNSCTEGHCNERMVFSMPSVDWCNVEAELTALARIVFRNADYARVNIPTTMYRNHSIIPEETVE